MNVFKSKYKLIQVGHVANDGALAKAAISTVHTTQIFGTQKILSHTHSIPN